jgi:hypothetical protein
MTEGIFPNWQEIPRTSVTSSNIRSVGYDPMYSVLVVEFHHGGIYTYEDVSQAIFDQFMAQESKGKFFIAHIRDKYATQKVG